MSFEVTTTENTCEKVKSLRLNNFYYIEVRSAPAVDDVVVVVTATAAVPFVFAVAGAACPEPEIINVDLDQ